MSNYIVTSSRRRRLDDETRTDIDHHARSRCVEAAKNGCALDVAWAPELRAPVKAKRNPFVKARRNPFLPKRNPFLPASNSHKALTK